VVQEYVSDLLKDYLDEANDDDLFHSPVGKIRGNHPFGALAAAESENIDITRLIRSKSNVHDVRESAKMKLLRLRAKSISREGPDGKERKLLEERGLIRALLQAGDIEGAR
jgi:hypothetical protein